MALSFPYPQMAAVARKPGQGCLSCVHGNYCPAMYWFRRYTAERRTVDNHMGIKCASWSNNVADRVNEPTEDDLDEEYYMVLQGITSEPDRCGITDMVTGSNRKP